MNTLEINGIANKIINAIFNTDLEVLKEFIAQEGMSIFEEVENDLKQSDK